VTDKLDLILDKIEDLKQSHGRRLEAIDRNLDIHMTRCDELEHSNELLKDHFNSRLSSLEEPKIFLSYVWRIVLGFGAIGAIVLTVIQIIKYTGV